MRLIFPTLCLVVVSSLSTLQAANDPGGGRPGGGPDVQLDATGAKSAILSNGRVTATIEKYSGAITSMVIDGTEMVDVKKRIYFSMDGGKRYDGPTGCDFAVHVATPEMIDVVCKRRYNARLGHKHALDYEIHHVLRRGDTGIYTYAVLSHPAHYPALEFGEWRMVWWLPHDGEEWSFNRVHVDAARHWDWGTYADFKNAAPTDIGEITRLTTGIRAGQYDCKYQYAAEYHRIGTWGHTGTRNKRGAWLVFGGYDYFNDGPRHTDLTLAEGYNLVHFGRNHFGGSGTRVAAGEKWSKCYGPYLLYGNGTTAEDKDGAVLWADARAQVMAEMAAWPYAWMKHPEYPAPEARGAVAGQLKVTDVLKPEVNAAGAWIGVAAPEDGPEGNWQYQSKGYQTWARAGADGRFLLRGLRPGDYTLYAFTNGATGEFSRKNVKVVAGSTTDLGGLEWVIPRAPGEVIAWEIGVPDRSAAEFFHGDDYWNAYLWETYCKELPNPLEFTVGQSVPSKHWNYAHSAYLKNGKWTPWKWRVRFTLAAVPAAGEATLTLALAGSDSAHLNVYMNDERKALAFIQPPNGGGNALMRQGIHAKYAVCEVKIPVAQLKIGENVLTLVQGNTRGARPHVMYDALSLVLPGVPAGG